PTMTRSRSRTEASVLIDSSPDVSLLLDPQIFERSRVGEAPNQVDPRLLGAWADAPDEGQLVDRDVRHPIVNEALDLVEQGLPLLDVRLARLPLEQVLDVRHDAGRVDTRLADVGFQPRAGVAAGAGDADDDVLELLLAPGGGHGRPLHRANLATDAHRLEVRGQRLAHREVGWPGVEVSGVDPVGVAGLGEELLGFSWIVGIRLEDARELQGTRDEGASGLGESEGLGLVQGVPIDGVARRLP